jgi:putative nucleotidyltransferase with HDIG domain
MLGLLDHEHPDRRAIVAVVESDVALALAVLTAARRARGLGLIEASVPRAVAVLGGADLERIASRVPTVGFFEPSSAIPTDAGAFRLHAVAVQQASERIRLATHLGTRDEVAVAALLHDIGKIVLLAAYDRYREIAVMPGTPEQRLALERRELAIDHAMAGGALARRAGFPDPLTATIGRHHEDGAPSEVAIVRLADMLAHYQAGHPVDPRLLGRLSKTVGLAGDELRSLLYEMPERAESGGQPFDPSPLSRRQHEVLRLLAEGKSYKEIGRDAGLSTSTVRSHMNAIYAKLGVSDRAQAVLMASGRGWL